MNDKFKQLKQQHGFKNSVCSYPDRGRWGDNRYRGNTTGHIIADLLATYHPSANALFCDPAVGGGTSIDVANEFGIRHSCHDLRDGFNLLRDDLKAANGGEEAQTVFFHPPYAGQIRYSGNMWGNPHPDDLSQCESVGDFCFKLNVAVLNCIEALKTGGKLAILCGNWRQQGTYFNLTGYIANMIPNSMLKDQIIKVQHNVKSDRTRYNGNFVPMMHEIMLVVEKKAAFKDTTAIALEVHRRNDSHSGMTWRAMIKSKLLGSKHFTLKELYLSLEHYAEKRGTNKNWQAKIRQIVQKNFVRVAPGTYLNEPVAA